MRIYQAKESDMGRIPAYITKRLKKEMNQPKNVTFQMTENMSPDGFWIIYAIAVSIVVDGAEYRHAARSRCRITKIETAERFLELAVPRLQAWCRKRTGEELKGEWYNPPGTKRRIL